ncbi:putative peptidase [Gemmata obscuriglobus]|uniref:Aminopeptidase P family protein n=1 Tax=Gemmata obscuriglobus TaxID=114 RepID=A0A2Z3GZH1_9BACT|nr:Xaa-Pro peptidase family protein [Gemmata obscuriglobus]AWM36696.1 aminopeptidase P family protein [Gemmata obscuriglobus]QEG30660.1 putative peptidase [Gemmata obscuriglobus]VTS09987.1 peptidase m24 : Peptidase M24 OS=Planctomyces limnophilus (strain ATCC 43296 / DSM 3776 / IFAM 1008 / 290) GN=Plim_1634 PE=4 SV=1: Peptidase_M24 [Gemmata obscuriglobus UQM 2246]
MLTAEGCRARRQRFLDRLKPSHPVVLADPLHLRYFANFYVDAISSSADFGGLLVIRPDGHATLYHDAKLPGGVAKAHADAVEKLPWYTGQEPELAPRRLVLRPALEANGGRIHDSIADPIGPQVITLISELRRAKDPDEVELLKTCMKASDAGHAWGLANIKPGMTELAAYAGVAAAAYASLGQFTTVYGDFTVSPGSKKRGGPPTPHVLEAGELFILDYSVIAQGYRSDFTNTICVGCKPTADQQRLMDLSLAAIAAGAKELKAGVTCQHVYDAIRAVFAAAGMAEFFTTHGGHGLGISHPEPPFIVRHSTETLIAGDVVTLEPGLYVDGIGGLRIEHNYLVTEQGAEQLSNHRIALS